MRRQGVAKRADVPSSSLRRGRASSGRLGAGAPRMRARMAGSWRWINSSAWQRVGGASSVAQGRCARSRVEQPLECVCAGTHQRCHAPLVLGAQRWWLGLHAGVDAQGRRASCRRRRRACGCISGGHGAVPRRSRAEGAAACRRRCCLVGWRTDGRRRRIMLCGVFLCSGPYIRANLARNWKRVAAGGKMTENYSIRPKVLAPWRRSSALLALRTSAERLKSAHVARHRACAAASRSRLTGTAAVAPPRPPRPPPHRSHGEPGSEPRVG
jgi:hypothetical protein